jgi:hypothetical protein
MLLRVSPGINQSRFEKRFLASRFVVGTYTTCSYTNLIRSISRKSREGTGTIRMDSFQEVLQKYI